MTHKPEFTITLEDVLNVINLSRAASSQPEHLKQAMATMALTWKQALFHAFSKGAIYDHELNELVKQTCVSIIGDAAMLLAGSMGDYKKFRAIALTFTKSVAEGVQNGTKPENIIIGGTQGSTAPDFDFRQHLNMDGAS